MKTLKSFVWLCFIAIAGISTSCDELKEALKADFNYEGDAIYVDIDPIDAPEDGSLQLIGSENYEFNLENILTENAPSFNIDNIREVNITNIQIELTNGDADNNIQNFESVYAEVYANNMTGKVVAEKTDIPNTQAIKVTIPINGGSVNLKDFVTKKSFGYNIKAKMRKSTTKTLKAKITADYNFVVGI
jgi:uncharacterized Zn finger protein